MLCYIWHVLVQITAVTLLAFPMEFDITNAEQMKNLEPSEVSQHTITPHAGWNAADVASRTACSIV